MHFRVHSIVLSIYSLFQRTRQRVFYVLTRHGVHEVGHMPRVSLSGAQGDRAEALRALGDRAERPHGQPRPYPLV